jgi:hypothetical protein
MEELIMDLQTTADQLQLTWKKEMVNNGQRCTNCERLERARNWDTLSANMCAVLGKHQPELNLMRKPKNSLKCP